ncbi:uncharacterized protein BDR25DRAFT_363681 [Lindgomyces ingoldianus]|uniref:Uncharacterized protein n=1 Tax=Lindgomyces ingoldianus TaxID=673940 RepID=A0ACB6Q788_9PLEO|nr:uncharacterized protein BDR25DRAFT_363681 [Lindgomyces ingoldianus]KAF2462709.1 hypothetical protein BDR25DRAFT_363681 [Lindgomyces ingoldianus]
MNRRNRHKVRPGTVGFFSRKGTKTGSKATGRQRLSYIGVVAEERVVERGLFSEAARGASCIWGFGGIEHHPPPAALQARFCNIHYGTWLALSACRIWVFDGIEQHPPPALGWVVVVRGNRDSLRNSELSLRITIAYGLSVAQVLLGRDDSKIYEMISVATVEEGGGGRGGGRKRRGGFGISTGMYR